MVLNGDIDPGGGWQRDLDGQKSSQGIDRCAGIVLACACGRVLFCRIFPVVSGILFHLVCRVAITWVIDRRHNGMVANIEGSKGDSKTMNIVELLPYIFTGIGTITGVGTLMMYMRSAKKNDEKTSAEASDTHMNIAMKANEIAREMMQELEARVLSLHKEVAQHAAANLTMRSEIARLQVETERLQEEITASQKKISWLTYGVTVLITQLEEAHITPRWVPGDDDIQPQENAV